MTFAEYQNLARRTQNSELSPIERIEHSLWGLSAEVGEVCGLFQKIHQGHEFSQDALIKEIGDVLWMVAELCDANELDMGKVAEMNIAKLRKRYPAGFEAVLSIYRGDE